MKSDNAQIGHNKPPKTLEEMINDQQRVKIAPDVLKLLKPIPDPKDKKGEKIKIEAEHRCVDERSRNRSCRSAKC